MIHTHQVDSAYLGTSRTLTVWGPARALQGRGGPYPVLYLNDGQNLFDPARAFAGQTWGIARSTAQLVRHRRIPPMLIVGIDHGGTRRAREYLPVEDDRNPDARQPLGREYVEFVTGEVLPFIRRSYPVARGASATGFGGSSYGGVAALYTALVKPGVFGRLLIESPSLYVGQGYLLRRARRATRWPTRVYLGVGTAETSRPDWNEETVANVLALAAVLRRGGLGPRRLRVRIAEGERHSESAWAARLPEALSFLFGA